MDPITSQVTLSLAENIFGGFIVEGASSTITKLRERLKKKQEFSKDDVKQIVLRISPREGDDELVELIMRRLGRVRHVNAVRLAKICSTTVWDYTLQQQEYSLLSEDARTKRFVLDAMKIASAQKWKCTVKDLDYVPRYAPQVVLARKKLGNFGEVKCVFVPLMGDWVPNLVAGAGELTLMNLDLSDGSRVQFGKDREVDFGVCFALRRPTIASFRKAQIIRGSIQVKVSKDIFYSGPSLDTIDSITKFEGYREEELKRAKSAKGVKRITAESDASWWNSMSRIMRDRMPSLFVGRTESSDRVYTFLHLLEPALLNESFRSLLIRGYRR